VSSQWTQSLPAFRDFVSMHEYLVVAASLTKKRLVRLLLNGRHLLVPKLLKYVNR
jgi:hypothetical protein